MKKLFSTKPFIILLIVLAISNGTQAADFALPPTTQIVRLNHQNSSVEMYAVSPTMKILPMQTIEQSMINGTYGKIYLAGAPGESEQIQLVIKPNSNAQSVELTFSDITGNSNISKENWSIQKVENVFVPNVSTHYGIWGGEMGYVPDPVVKTNTSVSLTTSQYNTILLKLEIPRNLQAGIYLGSLTSKFNNNEQVNIPVELVVWDFEFPTDKQIETYVCGVDMGRNAKVFDLLKGIATQVKYGSNKLITGYPNNELSILTRYYVDEIKKLRYDYGIKKVALPPNLLGQLRNLSNSYLGKNVQVGSVEFYNMHERFLTLMRDSIHAVGLQDNFMYYPMDEFMENLQPTFINIARQSKEIFPEMPVLALTPYMNNDVANTSDTWCIPWHFFSTLESDPLKWKEYYTSGLDLWAYMNSLYTINASWNPKGIRFFPTVLSRYNHNGALWWAINSYSGQDVWTTAGTAESNQLYGLGYLVYPPRQSETEWHSSLRWESYVQGTEDYRLMELLKERWRNTAASLNATSESFSAYTAMQMFGGMLSSSFRVQSYYAEPLYIDRFRQIAANEISTLTQAPLSLIVVQPFDTRQSTSVEVRGIVETGSEVTVNETRIANISSTGEFTTTVPLLQNGLNLLTIKVTKNGITKTTYREVRTNVVSSTNNILYGNNKDLMIQDNLIYLPYDKKDIHTVQLINMQGQIIQNLREVNILPMHNLNSTKQNSNIYLIKVILYNGLTVSYKILW